MGYEKDFRRLQEYRQIESAVEKKNSQFIYVRGRRRVGKSWLLEKLAKENKNIFYFMGASDAKVNVTMGDFAEAWALFSGDSNLHTIKKSSLNWSMLFKYILGYALKSPKSVVIILDEIQWIAKEGSGFIGKLKEAWVSWEKSKKIKVIVCGSSNKFFINKSGGEEQILRGLRTQADIIINPIPFSVVAKKKFKKWKIQEAAIAYMMTGGVPYYLNQIDEGLGFIHGLNNAFFVKNTIFLNEIDEILRLDFNKAGVTKVKKILKHISLQGCSQKEIEKKSGVPKATVNEILNKLVEYGIVQALSPISEKVKAIQAGYKYVINDYFINTYFNLIEPIEKKINANQNQLLFSQNYLTSDKGYYIPNYTGYMYEKLVRTIIEDRDMKRVVFKKLNLTDPDFVIKQHWDYEQQIDLIIEHKLDRISRALEIKWIPESKISPDKVLKTLAEKMYHMSPYYIRENYVVVSESRDSKKNKYVIDISDLIN